MKDNYVLIGMPGAGKSTVGVILAKVIGYRFIDADLLIQEREGKLLSEIINDVGVEGFIEIENEVNASIKERGGVIATGGSVVYGREAMAHLKEIGTVIYLKLSYKTISRRLHNIRGRGVVLRKGQNLKDIYDERCALYEQYADITLEVDGQDVEETISTVLESIGWKKTENARRMEGL